MEKERLKPEQMLVVAADFRPSEKGVRGIKTEVMKLAMQLQGTGVIIKLNSALRAMGYGVISEIHDLGVGVGADLKLNDIPETMEIDAQIIKEFKPEFLTVMCSASTEGMRRVKSVLADAGTEVLGVTVLTSFDEEECQGVYVCSTKAGVIRLARLAQLAGIDGLVLSPNELEVIKKRPELTLSCNTPGIRPNWTFVEKDDQKRTGTPEDAIKKGARRIIIGRPITQASDPKEAVKKTIDEIQAALAIF